MYKVQNNIEPLEIILCYCKLCTVYLYWDILDLYVLHMYLYSAVPNILILVQSTGVQLHGCRELEVLLLLLVRAHTLLPISSDNCSVFIRTPTLQ